MHLRTILLASGIAAAVPANAVSVLLFPERGCQGRHLHCSVIRLGHCCNTKRADRSFQVGPGDYFGSARFDDLIESEKGVIFEKQNGKSCGHKLKEVSGGTSLCAQDRRLTNGASPRSCLSCMRSKNTTISDVVNRRDPDDDDESCTADVEPDRLVLSDGHAFSIGAGTPPSVTEALYAYFDHDATFDDIPVSMHQYEIGMEGMTEWDGQMQ